MSSSYIIFALSMIIIYCKVQGICESGWVDGGHVGLGCLWLNETTKILTYSEAKQFCASRSDKKDSHLVEILTEDQMSFLVDELSKRSSQDGHWWGGARETAQHGWTWTQSGEEVGRFVWYQGHQPSTSGKNYSLCFKRFYTYKALPCPMSHKLLPICQKMQSGPGTKTRGLTFPNSTSYYSKRQNTTDTLVGVSVTVVVFLIVITGACVRSMKIKHVMINDNIYSLVWCWRLGACACCRRESVISEDNELYGPPSDDDQYAMDSYNTRVVDNNECYYDSPGN